MASWETCLISRVVVSGAITPVIEWGITESDFLTTEGRAIWRQLVAYYSNPHTKTSVLGVNGFQQKFPNYQLFDDPAVTVEALCYQVRNTRVVSESKQAALEFSADIESDPANALGMLQSRVQKLLALGTTTNADLTFAKAMDGILTRYQIMKDNPLAFAKVTWPWQILNDHMGGISEEDYIVIYGRPKSMKTWVLDAIMAHTYTQEKTAVFYTKEMTGENMFLRIAACVAGFPYQELRSGKLSVEDEEKLVTLADMVRDQYAKANLICLSAKDAAPGSDTVSWLTAKLQKYKPDICFVDGMYLMSDESSTKKTADWQRVTNISRGLRNMVLSTRTPVVCTMQANRGAAKHSNGNLDEIAYSDAVAQDATVAMRCIAEKHQPTIALVMAGSREFKLHGIRIHGIPATNFSEKEIMTEKDIRKAEEGDVEDDREAEDPANHARPRTPKTSQNGHANGAAVDPSKMIQQRLNSIP